jgi:hypothetical protein
MLELVSLPPQDLKINPYLEQRTRFERRIDRDFDRTTDDDRSDLLTRWRLGATLDFGGGVTGHLQYQYAHSVIWSSARNFSTENSDLSLAFLQFRAAGGLFTLGRQKIAIGQQRLIGPLEWANLSRGFEGARYQGGRWDLWASRIPYGAPRGNHVALAAVGYRSRYGETYAFYKNDPTPAGTVSHVTLNHNIRRQETCWNWGAEGALQLGRQAGQNHQAWAFHADAAKPLGPATRAFAEFNAASGGAPGESRTFDQLYPTNHNKYGHADMQGWRNMLHLSVGFEHRLNPRLSAHVAYHRFWLQNARDAWYGAGGAINRGAAGAFHDPTGAAGNDVGQEIDLELNWSLSPNASVQAGVAAFMPGNFVRRLNNGRADTQIWFFVQAGVRF